MEHVFLKFMWLLAALITHSRSQSTSSSQSGDSAEQEQTATINNFYMFPDMLDLPVQSDGSGLEDSEFHNFLGKFVILPEDEEANILESSFDVQHHVEDPHYRSKVSYAPDGTKVIEHERNATSPGNSEETSVDKASSEGAASDASAPGPSSQGGSGFDVNEQGLQVSYAADGTKIIQHAPTPVPLNKYNVTTPLPGPKPTLSIHYGIRYPKPNTTQQKYYLKDGTRITQFNTGIKMDNGTMKPKWQFLPDEYVPGFSDDGGPPNAAGYKYRNREGEKEKGKLIKQQIKEASKENNPTYQFTAEQDMASSLNKQGGNGSEPLTPESTKRYDSSEFTHPLQTAVANNSAKAHNNITYASNAVAFSPKVVHTVLYDVKPLTPHRGKDYEVGQKGLETGTRRAAKGHSKSKKKYHEFSKPFTSKSRLGKKKGKKTTHKKKNTFKQTALKSSLSMMPQPAIQDNSSITVSHNESDLRQALRSLVFKNEPGIVKKKQNFAYISQCGLYTEPQNVSQVQHAWATKTYSPYFYLYEKPKNYEQCKPSPWLNGTDMRGNVFISFEVKSIHGSNMENNAKICQKYCCKEPRCAAWVMRRQNAATVNCPKNSYCCWLKSAVPKREPNEDATSGIVQRERYRHPPTGMRSAVPLGGLGTGSFELRADGTFHEWTIENQSPGGAAKLSKTALDLMLFAVRLEQEDNHKTAALRTHAPHGFEGVDKMAYHGAYPVSKLEVGKCSPLVPISKGLDLTDSKYERFLAEVSLQAPAKTIQNLIKLLERLASELWQEYALPSWENEMSCTNCTTL